MATPTPFYAWRALTSISYLGKLAYTKGDIVPDANVALYGYDAKGLVERVQVTDTLPSPDGVDLVTQAELADSVSGLVTDSVAPAVDSRISALRDAPDGLAAVGPDGKVVTPLPDLSSRYIATSRINSPGGVASVGTDGKLSTPLPDLSSTYAPATRTPKMPRAVDLVGTVFLGHRGGGETAAPDGAIEAMRMSVSLGLKAIDAGDFRSTVDGGVIEMHDTTLDRTTNLTGNVSDMSIVAILSRGVIDSSVWFGGGWPDVKIPTLAQVFSEFGGKVVMFPEPKDDGAASAIANLISQSGIGPSVVVNSFDIPKILPSIAAGAEGMYLSPDGTVDPNSLLSQGIRFVGVQHGVVTLANVDKLAAAGLKVYVYTVLRQKDIAVYDGHNVAGYFSDAPLYTSRNYAAYRKTTAPWVQSGTFYHGHLSVTGQVSVDRGQFIGAPGAYRWQPTTDAFVLQGWGSPIANAASSYTLTVPVTFDTLPSDMSKHADIFVCSPTDGPFNNNAGATDNGYNILVRANGTVQIYKVVNGVTTGPLVASTVGPALAAGQVASLQIAITPAAITVTPTINGATTAAITANDSANRGGYFYLGTSGSAAGMRCSFGAITIS